ncbi:prepilin-type N-terminal cleavage/methylation domain-containing protein, partial [Escherichia coli]
MKGQEGMTLLEVIVSLVVFA